MRRNREQLFNDEQEVGRWLISYADFITLLFAFFVVMYSISQVNESKYKLLSESLVQAFDVPQKSADPIQIGEINRSDQPITGDDLEQPENNDEQIESGNMDSENFATTEEFKALENGLRESLGDLIDQELADISSDANWININLRSALLFPSGSGELNESADPLLEEVAKHLNSNSQLILVHGHTDNIPINTEIFPSNWELSSARGVAVVRKLQNLSVFAPRMSVEGHGEFQPIASNDTVEGRSKNRRVVISISRKQRIDVPQQTEGIIAQPEAVPEQQQQKEAEPEFEIVRLPGGGILIRGKKLPTDEQ
ncbi:flagellar motor protein MotB [Aliikangiella coralliicola]|uniref:OmpA family protein n=1 Tax=Aliikangiella coralliicola TaxID=2592383 RepID=A0A545UB51_9GAMM|nr:flagellar motor protein MotB [Aliikangiella coralliicola]TQV86690.1 OmpA family protein [Aliikangiella coralliicola]